MNYWAKRTAQAQEKLTNKSIAQTEKQLIKYYKSSMLKICGQFEKTYNKVLLSTSEGREPTPADLYKLDSYWQMQNQLRNELQRLGDKTAVSFSDNFMEKYKTIYEAVALPGDAAFSNYDRQAAMQMINQIWCADGKSWSQRVWENTNKLQETLNEQLIHCVVSGKSTTELNRMLQNEFGVSYRRADTIIRTEMAHIQTEAAKERYKDYGIKEVEIIVEPDACDICLEFEGQTFPIDGAMPVPAHPNCRCCVVPVIE